MEEINHECYVSLEVAKLLKEAGFNWEYRKIYYKYQDDDNWYLEDNYMNHSRILKVDYCLLAPTLEVAQKWLREVKNCSINIDVFVHNLDKNNIYYEYNWIIYFGGDRYSGSNWDNTRYYEVAQRAAIKKALEIILNKGENKI